MSVNDTHMAGSLRKASTAAKLAGLTAAMFVSCCDTGEIPVTVIRLGVRKCAYVRTVEFERWMSSPTALPKDLFA